MTRHALSLLVALLPFAACSRPRPPAPDILVIVIDTLRADHVSGYGYARETTPFLDRWANDAALYRRAYTHGTHTRISMGSFFTGTLPTVHRIRKVLVLKAGMGPTDALADGLTTFAESLRDAGYETWGLVANPHISENFGFTQGFKRFFLTASKNGRTLLDKFFADWAARPAGPQPPLFVYMHFMDVHTHYESRYDGSIRYVDSLLKELLQCWEAKAARTRATIVVSDHGQEFHEHGGVGHGDTVFEEVAHVVFLAKSRGIEPGRYDEPVGLVDVHRLLLDLAGATVPKEARGRPRAEWGHSEAPLYTESRPWIGFRTGSKLLVVNRRHPLWREYYDHATDPAELKPLSDKETLRQLFQRMQALIGNDNEIAERLHTPKSVVADLELAERLRALGYVDAR